MSGKIDDTLRLNHIIDAIVHIESFIEGISFDNFIKNELITSAVIRKLEIIGEASNHLSSSIKNKYSETDWVQIVGFRNIIAHEYFIVDNELVWEVVQNDLPSFKQVMINILEEFNN
ncbi:MAG: DUF86 domain-containing protein [Ignavibacteria bacterium]|nr:DUF86 domain-containing protein [Ignavibacteria bacterium]